MPWSFHGAPRYTGDIDLFVKPEPENAWHILAALTEFGFGSVGLETTDFDHPNQVIQLGVPPVRVDIITSITGVSWEEAHADWEDGMYGDIPIHYIGRDAFLANKGSGRRRSPGRRMNHESRTYYVRSTSSSG